MHMLFISLRRTSALTAALLVALAASGCAFKNPFVSKNPLIDDEPAPLAAAKTEPAPEKPVLPKPVLVVKPAATANTAPPVAPVAPTASALSPAASMPPGKPAPVPASAVPATVTPVVTTSADMTKVEEEDKPAPSGWQRWLGVFKPYKINIQQGNFISQDMAAKLRPGMTKEQVRFVLGTPLLTDMFHADRWDYLFRLQKPNGELTANRVSVFFRENRVERIQSSELPSESEYLKHIVGPVEPAKPATPPAKPSASSPQSSTQP